MMNKHKIQSFILVAMAIFSVSAAFSATGDVLTLDSSMANGMKFAPAAASLILMHDIPAAGTTYPADAPTALSAQTVATLTTELNNSNTKQNQIATSCAALTGKFNSLLTYLHSSGLMSGGVSP